ncbi:transposase (plasmid) [Azospirillum sp. B510]|nr:transposase [Azospirillum sp. B510]
MRWPRRCPAYRINCASSITCARRRAPSSRPTATPRRNSRKPCAGCGRSSAGAKGTRTAARRWLPATVRPDVRETHRWLHAAAHILGNAADHPATVVQARYDRLIATWSTRRGLTAAVDHFVKVTASYRPGLFHCYAVPDLPCTNNDLEHLFGCHRHHERRATGRKVASPSLVLRGSVRIVAATATRIAPFTARDLATDQARWLKLRSTLETRRQARVSRTRFRRDQDTYLAVLEDRACQQRLPS